MVGLSAMGCSFLNPQAERALTNIACINCIWVGSRVAKGSRL